LWLHSLKVAQLLRSAACLHTNQSRSYLNHLVWLSKQYTANGKWIDKWRTQHRSIYLIKYDVMDFGGGKEGINRMRWYFMLMMYCGSMLSGVQIINFIKSIVLFKGWWQDSLQNWHTKLMWCEHSNCRAISNVKNTAWRLEENSVACVQNTKCR